MEMLHNSEWYLLTDIVYTSFLNLVSFFSILWSIIMMLAYEILEWSNHFSLFLWAINIFLKILAHMINCFHTSNIFSNVDT